MPRIPVLITMILMIGLAAQAQIDPLQSHANRSNNGAGTIFNCPLGDGDLLGRVGVTVTFTIVDVNGQPVTGLTYQDFEIDGITPYAVADAYYPGPPAWDLRASGFQNMGGGVYVYTGVIEAGGHTPAGLSIAKVQGMLLQGSPPMALGMRSPDFDSNGLVNLVDISMFTSGFFGSYASVYDLNSDGVINLVDVSLLSTHVGHTMLGGARPDPVD